jgi:hypothetical protein
MDPAAIRIHVSCRATKHLKATTAFMHEQEDWRSLHDMSAHSASFAFEERIARE